MPPKLDLSFSSLEEFVNEPIVSEPTVKKPVVETSEAKTADLPFSQQSKSSQDDGFQPSIDHGKKVDEDPRQESECKDQEKEDNVNNTKNVNAAGTNGVNLVGANTNNELPVDPEMPALEDISTFNFLSNHEDDDEMVDMNNLDTTIQVSPNTTTRIHKDHPLDQVIGDLHSTTQTRHMSKNLEEHGLLPLFIKEQTINTFKTICLLALSQKNPKRAIGTKWVFWNKKDERGIVIRNKTRLVAQGHIQEEGIDYDEVFAPVARIEAIRLFLAYASFKDFMVYQMDVKSAFLYGKIEEEVFVCQPPGFEDPNFPDKVYKVKKALYGLHQAHKAWYETLSTYLLDNGFHRGKINKTLFIKRHKGDILLVQVYVDDIIFGLTKKELCNAFEKMMHEKFQMKGKIASTPMKTQKPLLKDEDGEEVDVHMYLKGQPKFGLWYLKDYHFDLVAYIDSDYAGASLDRKSTTGVNAAGMTYYCQLKVNTTRHKLTTAGLMLMLLRYALTVNLTIYTSYIEEFWATVKVKIVNGEVQLQALVDGKKVIITESTVRRYLQLKDTEGVDCLPNAAIFEKLTLIGKTKRKDTELPQTSGPRINIADEAVNEEMDDSLERAATTASSLKVEQDSGVNTPRKYKDHSSTGDCSLKRRVKKLEKKQMSRTLKLKRLYKVGLTASVDSSDEVSLSEDASKLGRIIDDIDADEGITLVNETVENQGRFDDKEFAELKQCLEIIPEDGVDVTIDATPLSSKSPTIVDYKIHKEGKKSYL
nr:hypothetical protein [Tanacetum cinerariifolium]